MIGSVAEMLSQSALRVLEDKVYSVRERGKERQYLKDTTYDFFKKIDPDLLPWGEARRHHLTKTERSYRLTPAECLFGVVEEQEDGAAESARNLAGRVRFSDAQSINKAKLMPRVTLKILSTPNTDYDSPCPAMYFHHKNDQTARSYISKFKVKANDHRPNGRKIYLHLQEQQIRDKYWISRNSKNAKQKMCCQPIEAGQDFYFHIDFDNLNQAELTLLLRSLLPSKQFQHRLGLGKSLGLGSVSITIEGIFLIDRVKRYLSDDLDGSRYHEALVTTKKTKWPDCYSHEVIACQKAKTLVFAPDISLIDNTTLQLLITAGNPANLQAEIKPPMRNGQNDPEDRTFEWFNKNDETQAQALPIIQSGNPLPTLDKN